MCNITEIVLVTHCSDFTISTKHKFFVNSQKMSYFILFLLPRTQEFNIYLLFQLCQTCLDGPDWSLMFDTTDAEHTARLL